MSPRVRAIIEAVAREHGVRVSDILSRSKHRTPSYARFDAYYRIRQIHRCDGSPAFSLPAIGQIFDRDHTSVLNGIRKWIEYSGAQDASMIEAERAELSSRIAVLETQIARAKARLAALTVADNDREDA